MKAEGYEPRFDSDLKRGQVGENLLDLFFADGEDNNLFEVKTDYRTSETGNIYVETHKFRNPDRSDLKPSGINVTESKWWVQSAPDGDSMFIIKTEKLRSYLASTELRKAGQLVTNQNTAASLGLLVPMRGLLQHCKMWKVND